MSLHKVGNGSGGGVRWASVDGDEVGGGGGNSGLGSDGGAGGSRTRLLPGGVVGAGGGATPPDSFMIARAKSLNRRVLLNVGGTKHEASADCKNNCN